MKKIAIVSPRLSENFSGAEIYIVSLAKHLAKKYEVHIITKKMDKEYPYLENLHMHYIEGIGSGSINIYKAIPNLKEELDKINPAIVHLHCFMSLMIYSLAVPKNKYKLITTVHSTPDGSTKLFSWFHGIDNQIVFLDNLYKNTGCDVTIFGSDYYKKEYLKYTNNMKESSCYVNPYFSDIKPISIEQRKKIDAKKEIIHILFPSRIVKRKGIEETLELLKKLPKNYILDLPAMPQIEYMDYNEIIKDKIKEMKLEDRICYPKKIVIGKDMYKYYKKADIVLIPSYFEGFGIVAVEAMNASVPVISTLSGGLGEIIEDNISGLKISLDNLEDARDKIIKLVEDKKLRYKIIKNAKKTIKEKYTKERHMKLIDKIYEGLLNEN